MNSLQNNPLSALADSLIILIQSIYIYFFFVPAPVNFLKTPSGKQRFLKEGISYEHQFNSRLDASYPARGKVGYVSQSACQVHSVQTAAHPFMYGDQNIFAGYMH